MIVGVARADKAVDAPALLRERVRAMAPLANRIMLTRQVAVDPESMLPPRRHLLILDQRGVELTAPDVVYGARDELHHRMEDALPHGWADVLYDVPANLLMPAT